MKVKFLKMHGLGNDFIMINDLDVRLDNYSKLAVNLCDRHFGIGADGIILIQQSDLTHADFKMRIFNPDGSEAEMCGNGIRCFAHYLHINDLTEKKKLSIETLAGLIKPEIIDYGPHESTVKVNMGEPAYSLESLDINKELLDDDIDKLWDYPLIIEGKEYELNGASMGNPHMVIYVDDLKDINLKKLGPIIEENPLFKKGTNVEFVKIVSKNELDIKVWERGAGITLACGTGACATAAVSIDQDRVNNNVKINLPGGPLKISKNENNEMMMTGPSTFVFKGEIMTGGI
ncbi:MAG TPA: diaminopimelate epimerase [Halanaerobiales bacterium]|nr:diaminopimelate epimerase [Halanaerobiales bacterium]